jgi:hypothetical protein
MRLPQLFLALAAVIVAAPAAHAAARTPYDRAMAPYIAELNRQCPGRHLENLTPGDFELIMEGFEERLTTAQRHEIEGVIGEACVRTEAGLTCGNVATIGVFRRHKVLPAFVHEVCATTWKCDAMYRCVQAQP